MTAEFMFNDRDSYIAYLNDWKKRNAEAVKELVRYRDERRNACNQWSKMARSADFHDKREKEIYGKVLTTWFPHVTAKTKVFELLTELHLAKLEAARQQEESFSKRGKGVHSS